ncbi:hypothetical protein N7540_008326 [Penicillium herquei]|nr:hypothetical protein N7540_008326 [Penicillium herquei]
MAMLKSFFGYMLLGTALSIDSYCPLYGPQYPPPTNVHQNSIFNTATNNITSILDAALPSDGTINTTSFAIQIFSTENSADDPHFTYYYTSPATRQASIGVTEIDGDTVFRIGSISKAWTIYLWLLRADGYKYFNQPIIDFIPELQRVAHQQKRNRTKSEETVDFAQWGEERSPSEIWQVRWQGLLEIVSLILRLDVLIMILSDGLNDLAVTTPLYALESQGFSALTAAEIPACGSGGTCNRSELFLGLPRSHPTFLTSHSPAYSNAAFQILAYALEKITKSTFASLLSEAIIKPLNLSRTTITAPPAQYGVIPGTEASSYWNFPLGEEAPAGGFYSSANDLSTVSRSILSNTLLPLAVTRRWLKPISHTSSLDFAVGQPWEIFSFQEGRPINLFTKMGNIIAYGGTMAFSPDHNAGFSVLVAGPNPALASNTLTMLSDLLSTTLIRALEGAARDEAQKFTGAYVDTTTNTNSSITLSIDSGPGISVTSWINNGVNMLQTVQVFYQIPTLADVSVRLYYTALDHRVESGSTFIGFRAVMRSLAETNTPTAFQGPIGKSCHTWQLIDAVIYGNVGLDEFLLEVNEAGEVISIQPRALRVTLTKQ